MPKKKPAKKKMSYKKSTAMYPTAKSQARAEERKRLAKKRRKK